MCPELLAVLEPSLVVDSPLVPTLSSPPAGARGGGGLHVLGSVRVAPVLPRAVSPSEWLLIRLAIKVGQ